MIKQYTKQIEVEAVQFTGDNFIEIIDFARPHVKKRTVKGINALILYVGDDWPMRIKPGDYVVRENGTYQLRKRKTFEREYIEVTEWRKNEH
jgi:hypothetical protein